MGAAGLMSGIGHPILTRLEAAGWVESRWEEVDPQIAGRPARRYYRRTRARTRRVGLGVGLPSSTGPTGTPSRTGSAMTGAAGGGSTTSRVLIRAATNTLLSSAMRERYRREHLEQLNALPTNDKIDYAVRAPALPWALQTPSDPNGSATRIRRIRGRLLVVQHVSFAGPGPLRAQLEAARLVLDVIDVSAAAALPSTLEHYDALVVLGGPQSVLDRQGWPTRTQEAALVAEALRDEVPYLGVCLGAQLLGVEAGGVAYRGPAAEVGWTRVATTAQCALDPVFRVVPRRLHVMSSHVDHVSLPGGATRLMSSSAYPNQAFRVGRIAWGTQFHPEADAAFAEPRRRLVPGWAEAEVPANGDERFFERHAGAIFAAVFSRFAAVVDAAATRRRELSPALLNRP